MKMSLDPTHEPSDLKRVFAVVFAVAFTVGLCASAMAIAIRHATP